MMYFAFGMPGPFEMAVILAIVLIFAGLGKLPKVLGQMGKGVREFKDGMRGVQDVGELDITPEEDAAPKAIESVAIEEAQEVASTPASNLSDAVTEPAKEEHTGDTEPTSGA